MPNEKQETCLVRVIHSEKVERAQKVAASPDQAEQLASLYKAFADQNRVRLLTALAAQEMCVCDIAAFLELSESAVSHQLRLLRTLNLVKNRREGNILYYRLADAHVEALLSVGLEHINEPR